MHGRFKYEVICVESCDEMIIRMIIVRIHIIYVYVYMWGVSQVKDLQVMTVG